MAVPADKYTFAGRPNHVFDHKADKGPCTPGSCMADRIGQCDMTRAAVDGG
jgi:hypothetical protein